MINELITKTVFSKCFGSIQPKWKDVKNLFEIQDGDFVLLNYDEEEDDWCFVVDRDVIESDEDYELILESNQRWVKEQKEKRYKCYLKLKQEFEIVNE